LLTPSLGDGLMLESIAVTIRGVSLQGGVGGIIPTISRSIFVTMLCNAIHLQNSSASLLPTIEIIGSKVHRWKTRQWCVNAERIPLKNVISLNSNGLSLRCTGLETRRSGLEFRRLIVAL
jgi:hypothetical protein